MGCELKKLIIVFCILQITSYVQGQFAFKNPEFLNSLLMVTNTELPSTTAVVPEEKTTEQNAAEENMPQRLCDCKTGTQLDATLDHDCTSSVTTTTQASKVDTTLFPNAPTTASIWKVDTTLLPKAPSSNEYTTTRVMPVQTTLPPVRTKPIACHLVGETRGNQYNCNTFYVCAPTMQGLEFVELVCPVGMAYSAELRRCARDISACTDDLPRCMSGGTFADGASTSTYILCVPDLSSFSFHKYRVRCASYESFVPTLGSCIIDAAKVQAGNANIYQIHDLDIIKAELDELKQREKALRKEEKRREKLQKKLEKEINKKIIKEAIERAELAGMDSDEIEDFVCPQQGAFPSVLGKNFYHDCVLKKGKLKSTIKLCPAGTYFSTYNGTCIL